MTKKTRGTRKHFLLQRKSIWRRDGFLQRSPGLTFAITNVSKEAKLFVFVLFTFAKHNTIFQTVHFCSKIDNKVLMQFSKISKN